MLEIESHNDTKGGLISVFLGLQLSGDTRKVSCYPQVSSYAMNLPLMKRSIEIEQFKTWAKKSMTKREEKQLLEKVTSRNFHCP